MSSRAVALLPARSLMFLQGMSVQCPSLKDAVRHLVTVPDEQRPACARLLERMVESLPFLPETGHVVQSYFLMAKARRLGVGSVPGHEFHSDDLILARHWQAWAGEYAHRAIAGFGQRCTVLLLELLRTARKDRMKHALARLVLPR